MSRRLAIVIPVLLASVSAQAHLMAAQRGTLNVVDQSVFMVLSVPVSALHGFDDDGDGVMSAAELQRHGKELREEIDRRFVVLDGRTAGKSMAVDLVLSPEHEAPTDRAANVVVLKHTQFEEEPTDLRLICDLFGTKDSERQLTIAATRPGLSGKKIEEVVTLKLGATEHHFFQHAHVHLVHLVLLLTTIGAALSWGYRRLSVSRSSAKPSSVASTPT